LHSPSCNFTVDQPSPYGEPLSFRSPRTLLEDGGVAGVLSTKLMWSSKVLPSNKNGERGPTTSRRLHWSVDADSSPVVQSEAAGEPRVAPRTLSRSSRSRTLCWSWERNENGERSPTGAVMTNPSEGGNPIDTGELPKAVEDGYRVLEKNVERHKISPEDNKR